MLLRLLAPLTVAAFTLFATAAMGAGEPQLRMPVRIVDVRGATALVSRGAAVLDARDAAAFAQGHIPGAQLYAWSLFTETQPVPMTV
jgi:3-mercaptopyruvate sulfurtransferase SseA